MTTSAELGKQPSWRGLVHLLAAFLGLATGLCTAFALVVTAAHTWQEHAESRWPAVTAHVRRCSLDVYTRKPDTYWIDCSVSYTVRGEEVVSHVHSLTIPAPSRVVWQYPQGQSERMQKWADEHPEGTPIAVHYDPANHKRAALVVTDMPRGGPQTPTGLKLVGFFAATCVVLMTIARILRPQSATARAQ